MEPTTVVYYRLATSFLDDDKSMPTGYDPKFFSSISDAWNHWNREYKTRKQDDGHDDHWNNLPFCAEKTEEITTRFWNK